MRRLETTRLVAFALIPMIGGCASSPLPERTTPSSPSSAEATPVTPANVTVALSVEPPLPGEPIEGWRGLAPDPQAPEGHDHHGHHGHGGSHAR